MASKKENPVIPNTSIHRDIWVKTCPYTIDLFKHTIHLFLTILIIWLTIKLTEFLFPNLPFAIIILIYLSEVALIIHFARESILEFFFHPSSFNKEKL